jgi:FdhD protein
VVLDVERVRTARRGTLTTSACGMCGRQSVDDLMKACGIVRASPPLPARMLAGSTARLRDIQRNFAQTGGVHAAAALADDGLVIAAFEDVGRHNAVDKVVGALVLDGRASRASTPPPVASPRVALLAVSGRASFEIVQKAAMAGIPVVASVSAASSLAVDLAERLGVGLAAFVRDGSFNLYTHPERIA